MVNVTEVNGYCARSLSLSLCRSLLFIQSELVPPPYPSTRRRGHTEHDLLNAVSACRISHLVSALFRRSCKTTTKYNVVAGSARTSEGGEWKEVKSKKEDPSCARRQPTNAAATAWELEHARAVPLPRCWNARVESSPRDVVVSGGGKENEKKSIEYLERGTVAWATCGEAMQESCIDRLPIN